MKKHHLICSLFLLIGLSMQAQVNVNVNLGSPPDWAPAEREEAQYYYLPDIDSYYDVPSARFIFLSNGNWIRSASLPYRYRNYNLRGGNVVYLTDYQGNSPYRYHKNHLVKYPNKIKFVDGGFKNGGNGNGGFKKGGKGGGKGKGKK